MSPITTDAIHDTTTAQLDDLMASWRRHMGAQRMSPATMPTYGTFARQLVRFLAARGMPTSPAADHPRSCRGVHHRSAVVAAILAVGGCLAFGGLAGQRGAATTIEAIPVRLSMAGFTPSEVKVPAGKTIALELWTTDADPHLHNGVHTMISDELDIYEEPPAATQATNDFQPVGH